MIRYFLLPLVLIAAALPGVAQESHRRVADEDLIVLQLETGPVFLELASEAAPQHTAHFRTAVRQGLFDGEFFYRVIEGHVAQAGVEFEHLTENWPEVPLEAERSVSAEGFVALGNADLFASEVGHRKGFAVGREGDSEWLLNCPGSLGMARSSDPDTGSTEFYIPIGQRRYLDRNYTIFGRVIGGMEHINRLMRARPTRTVEQSAFLDPDTSASAFADRAERLAPNRILSAKVAADIPEDMRPHWRVMRDDAEAWQALKDSKRDYSEVEAFVSMPPKVVDICTLPVPAEPIVH